jgi:transcriptional regulator with XRE-family HTH domain
VLQATKPAVGVLADKLNQLFRAVHPEGRGEYSVEELVALIRARGGPSISAAYVYQLRNGQRDNPTKHHLEALADAFGVSPTYFFGGLEAEAKDEELNVVTALRDPTIREIALEAFGLSTQSLQAIAGLVHHARTLERLAVPERRHRRRAHRPLKSER